MVLDVGDIDPVETSYTPEGVEPAQKQKEPIEVCSLFHCCSETHVPSTQETDEEN